MKITVFCASSELSPMVMSELRIFGEWIGQEKHELIYGGTATGAMFTVADACLKAGGKVTGIIPEVLATMPRIKHPNHHYDLVDSMANRKSKMAEVADIIVAGPGGLGTLDEFTEVLTLKALGQIRGKLFLLSPFDYWGPLIDLFTELKHRGAMTIDFNQHYVVTEKVQDLIESINNG